MAETLFLVTSANNHGQPSQARTLSDPMRHDRARKLFGLIPQDTTGRAAHSVQRGSLHTLLPYLAQAH